MRGPGELVPVRRGLDLRWPRVVGAQVVFLALAFGLVVSCDEYYRPVTRTLLTTGQLSHAGLNQNYQPAQPPTEPRFSVPGGVDVRKVDLSIELQILAFHEQRKGSGPLPHTEGATA